MGFYGLNHACRIIIHNQDQGDYIINQRKINEDKKKLPMKYYSSQSVIEVRDILRDAGLFVGYKEKLGDPEYPNAYICSDASLRDIVAVVSSTIRWRRDRPEWNIPEESNACIQIISLNKTLHDNILEKLKIIKHGG